MTNRTLIASTGAIFTLLGFAALTGMWTRVPQSATAENDEAAPPAEIHLTGTVRDFREHSVSGGHPDMESQPDNGFGRYSGNISVELGSDGKPVFTGTGHKVTQQWRDAAHRQICHALYDPALADTEGSWGQASTGGIQSAASFGQWYHDAPGMNLSAPLTLALVRQYNGMYVFDDKDDPLYSQRGGFFPIDDQLFGNSPGSPKHNYHFTFELHSEFTYVAAENQVFKFIGDDDVFVFVDGKLVIDLGGVHAAHDQVVEMNRLGLEDGKTYNLDFFFAERHRTQSNFRIETNLVLDSGALPTITTSYD